MSNLPSPDSQEKLNDPPLPLTVHLYELRKRLVIICVTVTAAFIGALTCEMELGQPILGFFRRPLDARHVPLVFDELTEPLMATLRISFYAALFLCFPIILGQIWLFVKPALYPKEQKWFWPFLISSSVLFVGGGLFGYFAVVPFGYDFFLSFSNANTLPSLRMSDYLSFTIHLLFGFGLTFEMPVIAFFLVKIDLISSAWLKEYRRYAIVFIFIISAIMTPPDPFTQTMMAIPLVILYELSIWVAKWTEKQRVEPPTEAEAS